AFAIYRTGWFAVLLAVLGINVLNAALTRLPWKRRHVGFLVTHAGILVLLFGCWVSRRGGEEAYLTVYEGLPEGRPIGVAFAKTAHFRLTIHPEPDDDSDELQQITVRFAGGPFNWEDYADRWPFPWRYGQRHTKGDVLFEEDGIKLEVLDYYSDSAYLPTDPLTLQIREKPPEADETAAPEGQSADTPSTSAKTWEVHQLAIAPSQRHDHKQPYGTGSSSRNPHVSYWATGSFEETRIFSDDAPVGPIDKLGQIVLHVGGRKFHVPLADLAEDWHRQDTDSSHRPTRFPVIDSKTPSEESGLTIETTGFSFWPHTEIGLKLHGVGDSPVQLTVSADAPQFNQHDYRHGVIGACWTDASQLADVPWLEEHTRAWFQREVRPWLTQMVRGQGEPPAEAVWLLEGLIRRHGAWFQQVVREQSVPPADVGPMIEELVRRHATRVDILGGADRRLHCRVWSSSKVEIIGLLPVKEPSLSEPIEDIESIKDPDPETIVTLDQFAVPVQLAVARFEPVDHRGRRMTSRAFVNKENSQSSPGKQPQAKVRLTVDSNEREFWLAQVNGRHLFSPLQPEQREEVQGKDRRVVISLNQDELPLGFRVRLKEFVKSLDLGSHAVRRYASRIDFLPADPKEEPLLKDIWVELNEPVDFADPKSKRSYRIFQSSFEPVPATHQEMRGQPYENPEFRELTGDFAPTDLVYGSVFSMNYDPGRGVKYAGSLMITAGIAIIFYMRKYFHRKRRKVGT
ncbi:MAG: hypothetical protein HQ581_14495, partial [Planctomycetes bacterium]|nr:hypothetical protein [Planctomycetota bacterium]